MSKSNQAILSPQRYRIGAVANITGLSTHTIRAWERRYGLEMGTRSEGGTREYADDDVSRLLLLNELTSKGEAISAIALLSMDELKERLAKHPQAQPASAEGIPTAVPQLLKPVGRISVCLYGEQVMSRFSDGLWAREGIFLRQKAVDAAELYNHFVVQPNQLLLTHLSDLGDEPLAFLENWIEQSDHALAVVHYDFAPRELLDSLLKLGVRLLSWPISEEGVVPLLRDLMVAHQIELQQDTETSDLATPDRVFSDSQLAKIAQMKSPLKCGCPQHLSGILSQLNAFEKYSVSCAVESEADRELHEEIAQLTALARSQIEDVLARVCTHERIVL